MSLILALSHDAMMIVLMTHEYKRVNSQMNNKCLK